MTLKKKSNNYCVNIAIFVYSCATKQNGGETMKLITIITFLAVSILTIVETTNTKDPRNIEISLDKKKSEAMLPVEFLEFEPVTITVGGEVNYDGDDAGL